MLCAILYHLCNWKLWKTLIKECLFFARLPAKACNFTKSKTPPWVFFTFLKLCKWYQVAKHRIYIWLYALLKFYEWYECSRNLGLRQSLETGYSNMTFFAKALFFNKITRCHRPLSNDVVLVNKQLHCNQMQ